MVTTDGSVAPWRIVERTPPFLPSVFYSVSECRDVGRWHKKHGKKRRAIRCLLSDLADIIAMSLTVGKVPICWPSVAINEQEGRCDVVTIIKDDRVQKLT